MSDNMNAKIGQATVWSSVTQIIAKLISPIVNMILARLLTPDAFGVVATVTMVISFAEIFTDAGFQRYIIQHNFESEDELDKSTNVAFITNLILSLIVCLVIFLFRHNIASLVGSPGHGNSISIASLAIILVAFSSIQSARFRRSFNFKTLFFIKLGNTSIPLVITIPLAIIFRNYWALIIGMLTAHFFDAVVLTIKSKWKPRLYYSFALFKEMFSFSIWSLFESISIWLTSYIGVFVVGRTLNTHYLGLYNTSIGTVNAYMSIITAAISPVLFSALSRAQDDEGQFSKTYYFFQRIVAVFVLPMGFGIYIFKDLVTLILLGEQWMEASDFIGLWGLTSALVIAISYFASDVYRSKGNPRLSTVSQLLQIAVLIPALIISSDYGFKAIYITRSLARIELLLSALIFMHFIYKFKVWDVFKNIMPMLISSCVMSLVAIGLNMIWEGMALQIVAVLICVIVYFAVLLIFPQIRREIFDGARKFLRKNKRY